MPLERPRQAERRPGMDRRRAERRENVRQYAEPVRCRKGQVIDEHAPPELCRETPRGIPAHAEFRSVREFRAEVVAARVGCDFRAEGESHRGADIWLKS